MGVANYLAHRELSQLKGDVAGRSLEHYILMELIAYRGLGQKRFEIRYWRTKTGLEVDFILGDALVAIEIKISNQVHAQDLRGLSAFCEEHPDAKAIVVSQDAVPRKLMMGDNLQIHITPWRVFLEQLWARQII